MFTIVIGVYLTSLSLPLTSGFSAQVLNDQDKTVLVFGGNGFIGSATTERLLAKNYSVVLINRGNWYWDTADTIRPRVIHWKCDRMQSLQRCTGLQDYIWNEHKTMLFDAVIDFSAYHAFEINEALNMLHGRIKRYIYISSDSVYDVCNKTHAGLTREQDAVRPCESKDRELYKQKDDYGNRKLECEEELHTMFNREGGVPYVTLRLPDVIGPRDNTYRWWIYQLWVKLADYIDKPLSVPKRFWNQPISFVYSNDVADVILDVINAGSEIDNQAFNLALDETPTLRQFLHSLMDILDTDDIDIEMDESQEAFHLFPSVRSGPLDVTKAKSLLDWKPTSWIDILDANVAFYENAMKQKQFVDARKDVVRTIQQYLTRTPSKVVRGLLDKYNIALKDRHEEL